MAGRAAADCILYSVICLRGNGVIRRTQKVIQGDDNGHVGNVKWFSVASPGPAGILRKTQFLRYYSVREPN